MVGWFRLKGQLAGCGADLRMMEVDANDIAQESASECRRSRKDFDVFGNTSLTSFWESLWRFCHYETYVDLLAYRQARGVDVGV